MPKKLTKEEFIKRAKLIHGDKYDYSLVEYKKTNEKIKIVCPEHGAFVQILNNHLKGSGCPKCGLNVRKAKRQKSKEQFVKEANLIHNNKYNYSLADYINTNTKVKIICPFHGIFEQKPSSHLMSRGCPFCANENKSKNNWKKIDTEEFIKRAKLIHGNKYDYSLVNYIDSKSPVKIICPFHGIFEQKPNNHLNKHNCPKCKSSKGEITIRNYLLKNNIIFEEQKRFKECKDKLPLSYDFYLPKENLLIEYNGIQHYESVETFGGKKKFLYQQHNDELKREFAEKSGIRLLTISYKDYNIIEKILEEEI